ncbi:MAG: M23 family metallopeptidase [Firmicutes bacterium]|nr:M23 family metallopeptidase [Bacillota bacterium]
MEGRTKRRKKQLAMAGAWARLAALLRRAFQGVGRGTTTAWRGILRAMPPRDAVIVVVAGGVAFGLGVALGRITMPPATPLDRDYVTIERVNLHEAETGAPATAWDARLAAGRPGAPPATPPTGGGLPVDGRAAPGEEQAADWPEVADSETESAGEDEGAGVVGPVPTRGAASASPSPSPAVTPSPSPLPEGSRPAAGSGAGAAATPPQAGAEVAKASTPSPKAAPSGGAPATPAASGPSAAAPAPRPAASSPQAPRKATAPAPRHENMLMPVQGRIISEFGWRRHPVFADWRYHTGIDIAAAEGIPVRAALSGKVVEVKNDRQLGLYVVLEHEGGLRTKYGHLESSSVFPGDQLIQGQSIGRAGSSGVTSGCYLHFEVIHEGKAQDPRDFL